MVVEISFEFITEAKIKCSASKRMPGLLSNIGNYADVECYNMQAKECFTYLTLAYKKIWNENFYSDTCKFVFDKTTISLTLASSFHFLSNREVNRMKNTIFITFLTYSL